MKLKLPKKMIIELGESRGHTILRLLSLFPDNIPGPNTITNKIKMYTYIDD